MTTTKVWPSLLGKDSKHFQGRSTFVTSKRVAARYDDADEDEVIFVAERQIADSKPSTSQFFSKISTDTKRSAGSFPGSTVKREDGLTTGQADWILPPQKRPYSTLNEIDNGQMEKKARTETGQPTSSGKSRFRQLKDNFIKAGGPTLIRPNLQSLKSSQLQPHTTANNEGNKSEIKARFLPFQQVSSDDEDPAVVIPASGCAKPSSKQSLNRLVEPSPDLSANQAAKLESKRLRQEALWRKQSQKPEKTAESPAEDGPSAPTMVPRSTAPVIVRKDSLLQSSVGSIPNAGEIQRGAEANQKDQDAKRAWELAVAAGTPEAEAKREALKEADAKRREEAERKDREKHAAEQANYEQIRKARAEQRALFLKGQAAIAAQQNLRDSGFAALSRLETANKATQARKVTEEAATQSKFITPTIETQRQPAGLQTATTLAALPSSHNGDHKVTTSFDWGLTSSSGCGEGKVCAATESVATVGVDKSVEQEPSKLTSLVEHSFAKFTAEKKEAPPRRTGTKEGMDCKRQQAETLTPGPEDAITGDAGVVDEEFPTYGTYRRHPMSLQQRARLGKILPAWEHTDDIVTIGDTTKADEVLVKLIKSGKTFPTIYAHFRQHCNEAEILTTLFDRYKQIKATIGLFEASSKNNSNATHHGHSSILAAGEPSTAKRNRHRKFGPIEITPMDMYVRQLRNKNFIWDDILDLLSEHYNYEKSKTAARDRYKVIIEAIRSSAVPQSLLDAAEAGDRSAFRSINKLTSPRINIEASVPAPILTTPHYGSPDRLASCTSAAVAAQQHPQYGGKTLNEEFFRHLMEMFASEQANEDDAESEDEEPEQPTHEDYCHFIYRIQRRQLRKAQLDEGHEIEDQDWVFCGREYDILQQANQASDKWLFRVAPGAPGMVNDEDGEINSLQFYWREGRKLSTFSSEQTGVVQVRVVQDLRMREDGVLPGSRVRMFSRTVFVVMKGTTPSSTDEQPNEESVDWNPTTLDNEVHTELKQANERAAGAFVGFTFRSQSQHLGVRQAEAQEMERNLTEELDEEELFSQTGTMRSGEKVKVWVEARRLRGPRNMQ